MSYLFVFLLWFGSVVMGLGLGLLLKTRIGEKKCSGFWFHDWTEWKTTEKGNVYTVSLLDGEKRIPTGSYEVQRRECETCKKSQLRTVRTNL